MSLREYPTTHPEESGLDAKTLGAFYTDAQIADFLAWWAIRAKGDTVFDPCFGGGIFLRSACKRLSELAGHPESQVSGAEIDPEVFKSISAKLIDEFGLPQKRLRHIDFFHIEPCDTTCVDALIGNPPFIRYQRFNGEARKVGLARSTAQGVRLPQLCSSWAPFVVHCIAMLRPGGRLAMVMPMEIAHAKYARPVLEHIHRSFGRVTFLTFRRKLFPDLSEDALLLLAEKNASQVPCFLWRDFAHPGQLSIFREKNTLPLSGMRKLNAKAIASGGSRLVEQFIPSKAQDFYRDLKSASRAQRLGDLADVGIGYVTGANDFFHLTPDDAARRRIPHDLLKPAVRRGRALSGLRFTLEDWRRAVEIKEAGYLLHIDKDSRLPQCVHDYLAQGRANGIEQAYKCRTRLPWYCVPHVYKPDAFLTYMSGVTPRLVVNEAGAFAPNSLHVIRLHRNSAVSGDAVAALWQTSLTRLSVEIEGHALGGGLLKLEPTEAESVLVAFPEDKCGTFDFAGLTKELDQIDRVSGGEAAQRQADAIILEGMLGFTTSECELLRSAIKRLRSRRGYRGAHP